MTADNLENEDGTYLRRQWLKLAGVGIAGGLAGCGGGGDGDGDGGGGGGDGGDGDGGGGGDGDGDGDGDGSSPTEITYFERDEIGNAFAEAFNESHSDISVEAQIGSESGEGYRQFISQMNSDRGPDVLGADMILRNSFIESDYLRSMEDLMDEIDYRDEFLDAVDPLFVEYEGTPYSVPFYVDPSNYYYNTQHFEDVGLDPESPPETWDEFYDAAETLTEERDNPAVSLNGIAGSTFLWLPWVWTGGGRFINDDNECVIDEEPGVNALEFWVDMANEGLCVDPVATQWTDMVNMFVNEDTSIMFHGGGGIGAIRETNPDLFDRVNNHPFPKPEGGAHAGMAGGNAIAITTMLEDGSDELEASREFVKWINEEEGMRTIFEQGYVPGRESGFDLDIANQEETAHLYEGLMEVLKAENTRMLTNDKGTEAKQEYLIPALESAYGGSETPEEALSRAAEEINENVLDG